jgi:membrane protein YqaA with SNARE-associated domain
MVYITLFFIAFLSGSLLPLGSEALFIYDISKGYNITFILLSATIGNVLGAVLNYYLGLKGEEYLLKKSYLSQDAFLKAKKRFGKYGAIALLLSALPVIGDPLTFIAGALKYNFKWFLILVTISKFTRYLILAIFF